MFTARYGLSPLIRPFATTVSELNTCDFFWERLLEVLRCSKFLSATTTQLLSSDEFCKLRYDTMPVKIKSVPLQAWSGPEGYRKLRFPNFMKTAQEDG